MLTTWVSVVPVGISPPFGCYLQHVQYALEIHGSREMGQTRSTCPLAMVFFLSRQLGGQCDLPTVFNCNQLRNLPSTELPREVASRIRGRYNAMS